MTSSSVPLMFPNTLMASCEKPAGPVSLRISPGAANVVCRFIPLTASSKMFWCPVNLSWGTSSAVVWSRETTIGGAARTDGGRLRFSRARAAWIWARSRGVSPPSRR